MRHIQATAGAFTAVLEDGSAVTWGHPDFGGDSSAVQSKLRGVREVQASDTWSTQWYSVFFFFLCVCVFFFKGGSRFHYLQ